MSEDALKELVEQGFVYPRSIKLSDYKRLFTIPTNLLLFLQGIAGSVPWGAIPLFLVVYLQRVKGFDLNGATTVFMFFGVGNILGIVIGGFIGGALYRRSPGRVGVAYRGPGPGDVNLTDSLGTGFGRFVGGWLAQLFTIGPAMTISSVFWLPCGIFLLILARLFPRDVDGLRQDMRNLADELAGKASMAKSQPI